MTNSFCCLYLLFSVSVPAPSSSIKCLTLAPTTYMYYMYVFVYSLLHICDSMAAYCTMAGHMQYTTLQARRLVVNWGGSLFIKPGTLIIHNTT